MMKPIKLTARESNLRQKAVADEIARLVGGKAGRNTIHVQGEPPSGYRVTLHRDPFWFRVRISDKEFVFAADHQRGAGEKGFFGVNLFKPWQMGWPQFRLRVAHKSLSKELGAPVKGPLNEVSRSASAPCASVIHISTLPERLDWNAMRAPSCE